MQSFDQFLIVLSSSANEVSFFHRHAQQTAFRYRGARQQSRLSAPRNQRLRPAQTPTGFAEIVGDYLPVYVATLEYG
jgi:hypothetical protein